MEYGSLVTLMMGELDEVLDKLDWGTLQSCEISKVVAGGSTINGESGGKFTTGDIA